MQRISILLSMLAVLAFTLTGCWTTVEPGYVGIKVNKHGNQRGVEDFPISTGRVGKNFLTETVYTFPTFMQRVPWTADRTEGSLNDDSITFNSVEGAPINVDVSFAGSFSAEKVPALFVEFRKSAELIVNGWVRDQVRNCLNKVGSTRKAVSILGEGKSAFLTAANDCVRDEVTEMGFEFDSVSLLGEARVPERVRESIQAVIEQTQAALKAQAKVVQAAAEADQVIETARGKAEAILSVANAQAKANNVVAKSLTPALIQYKALEVWNGDLPKFTGGGAVPFIDVSSMGSE